MLMQRFILPKIKSSIFEKEHGVFWFSSKELLLIWDKKKKSLFLPVGSGFADGREKHRRCGRPSARRRWCASWQRRGDPSRRQ